jgi:molecular chaperone DnaK
MSAATVEPKVPADGLPVFVANGRRRDRAVRVGKLALGIALAGWIAALCASLIGFAPLPVPALSSSDDGQAVSAVRPQSPDPRTFGDGVHRDAHYRASGVKSSTAARRGGGGSSKGAADRSPAGTSNTVARTHAPTADVTQTSSTSGSSSNQTTNPPPTSTPPAPSPAPPPPAPPPTSTTPPPSDSTSPPDQPGPTGSPDGSGGTTSGSSSGSTTPTPDTSGGGSVPG